MAKDLFLPLVKILKKNDRIGYANKTFNDGTELDKHLLLVQYSLLLVSEQIKRSAGWKIFYSAIIKSNGTKIISIIRLSSLISLATRLRTFSNLISDVRIFDRLWGMIPMVAWAISRFYPDKQSLLLSSPIDEKENEKNEITTESISLSNQKKQDKLSSFIQDTQVISMLVYQVMENVAYLGMHNILPISSLTQAKLWIHSCRLWAAYVILDIIRLIRVKILSKNLKDNQENIKSNSNDLDSCKLKFYTNQLTNLVADPWFRELLINLGYLPLTIHWSVPGGVISDHSVGLCGTIVGLCKVIPIWI